MESDKKMEMMQKVIRKLMEDEEMKDDTSSSNESLVAAHEDGEDNEKTDSRHRRRRLLSKLLSEYQLESLEEDNNATDESKQEAKAPEIDEKMNTSKEVGDCSDEEKIIKELKNVKRQNSITHYLLTALIVITLAWQLSEVSLILKIKDGLSNPFKSIGGIIKGFLKKGPGPETNVQDAMKQALSEGPKQFIEPTYLPGLRIPELPHLELPGLEASDDDDDDDHHI